MDTTTTTYANLTDEGRKLAGKLLPMARHFNGMPIKVSTAAPKGVSARKPETADKYHARVMAAILKNQTDQYDRYIGRPDERWILRATDGHLAAFEKQTDVCDRPELTRRIATIYRPAAFQLTPALELAIKRARIVSAPADFITLKFGVDYIDVEGNDLNGSSSSERVDVMTQAADAITIRVDADLILHFFGAIRTTIASIDPGTSERFPSLSIDYAVENWRYVLTAAK